MFKCDKCGLNTKPREKLHRLVTATRVKAYRNDRGRIIGVGKEIVEEIKLCPACQSKFYESTK